MGNEAIAWALAQSGCTVVTSYPGTPASEIVDTLLRLQREHKLPMHVEWSVNEKVAFEVALANSYLGARSAVAMKQVGLNVASDPLMSSAYTGVKGGFLVIAADDPGPHSSQTEQDSRFMAMFAKIPVFDPSSPRQAMQMVEPALKLSEEYEIPVMLRPTTRICHSRQDIEVGKISFPPRELCFLKEPGRWAATPRFRFLLHQKLNDKLDKLAVEPSLAPVLLNPEAEGSDACVLSSGVALANVQEIMEDLGLYDQVPIYQVIVPYPLHFLFAETILHEFKRILVVEETYPVIELQLRHRDKVYGRLSKTIPNAGELEPQLVETLLRGFFHLPPLPPSTTITAAEKRPTLCPGCPHRAAFFALKRAMPKAIFPSDIGCYTLGLNLGAVDTVLCMGASISQAAGFYHSHQLGCEDSPPLAVTIGDSTFFHAGIPALLNSVTHGARFVLLILDNGTTAMTGCQPTPESGPEPGSANAVTVSLEEIVRGCGVRFVRTADPYNLGDFIELIREAHAYSQAEQGGISVVISRHPCLMDRSVPHLLPRKKLAVTGDCQGCRYCLDHFECPALLYDDQEERVHIDHVLCVGCGVCLDVCPRGAIEEVGSDG
ncbi:MAG: 4Fe-4S binding protein [Deltaproteobacteria bacterium]|nr:4Fe-4S binding protein [Deltaproteobacteria bacterium]MBW2070747.1 4Fe-4S binding protein [Deltaproteobacteria bacterium]